MLMIIRFLDGHSEDAILLSDRGDTLRVAMRDRDDSAEFRFADGVWLSEGNIPAWIEIPEDSGVWFAGEAATSDWIN